MAVYLPGPIIKFPPPPDPGGDISSSIMIAEPSITYSAGVARSNPGRIKPAGTTVKYKLINLINPLKKQVEFTITVSTVLTIGKRILKAGDSIKVKVPKLTNKGIAFWTVKNITYKQLSVSDNAGRGTVYWSLSGVSLKDIIK